MTKNLKRQNFEISEIRPKIIFYEAIFEKESIIRKNYREKNHHPRGPVKISSRIPVRVPQRPSLINSNEDRSATIGKSIPISNQFSELFNLGNIENL